LALQVVRQEFVRVDVEGLAQQEPRFDRGHLLPALQEMDVRGGTADAPGEFPLGQPCLAAILEKGRAEGFREARNFFHISQISLELDFAFLFYYS